MKSSAKQAFLDQAVDWVAGATLSDFLSFVTVRQVAKATNRVGGSVTHRCPTVDELRAAIIERAFARYDEGWSYARLIETVHDVMEGRGEDRDLAQAIAEQVGRFSPGPDAPARADEQRLAAPVAMLEHLLALAAPNDPDARELVVQVSAKVRATYVSLIEPVMAGADRRWRAPFTAERFALVTQALVEGFVHLRRFDAAAASLDQFAAAWLAMFAACTFDPEDLADRGVTGLLALLSRSADVPYEQICDVSWRLFRARGTNGVRHDAVARAAGVEVHLAYRAAPTRQALHACAFRGGVAALASRSKSLGPVDDSGQARSFLNLVADFAYAQPGLAEAFLAGGPGGQVSLDGPYDPAAHVAALLGRRRDDARSCAAVAALITLAVRAEDQSAHDAVETVWPVLAVPNHDQMSMPTG